MEENLINDRILLYKFAAVAVDSSLTTYQFRGVSPVASKLLITNIWIAKKYLSLLQSEGGDFQLVSPLHL